MSCCTSARTCSGFCAKFEDKALGVGIEQHPVINLCLFACACSGLLNLFVDVSGFDSGLGALLKQGKSSKG